MKRRTGVVAIFPNSGADVRLVGAMLLEQNDERAVNPARHMSLEKLATHGKRSALAASGCPQSFGRHIA